MLRLKSAFSVFNKIRGSDRIVEKGHRENATLKIREGEQWKPGRTPSLVIVGRKKQRGGKRRKGRRLAEEDQVMELTLPRPLLSNVFCAKHFAPFNPGEKTEEPRITRIPRISGLA